VFARFDSDHDFMRKLFKQYKEQLPERMTEIRSAVQDCDINRLVRLAHNLKGVSLNFSADSLANLAICLEEMSKREDITDAPLLLEQLEAEASRLTEYLSQNGY
jgi:HPt (histidine-containing phosphotransfer) domain-containing protein